MVDSCLHFSSESRNSAEVTNKHEIDMTAFNGHLLHLRQRGMTPLTPPGPTTDIYVQVHGLLVVETTSAQILIPVNYFQLSCSCTSHQSDLSIHVF